MERYALQINYHTNFNIMLNPAKKKKKGYINRTWEAGVPPTENNHFKAFHVLSIPTKNWTPKVIKVWQQ